MSNNHLTEQEKAALLAGLLSGQPIAPTAPTTSNYVETSPPPQTPTKPKAKTTHTSVPAGLYDKAMRIIGLCGAIALMVGLWAIGAYFTLQFLEGLGLKLAGAGAAAWLIPATVTAMEIGLWPAKMPTPTARLAWFLVLAADAGTTAAGIVAYAQGKVVVGITLAGPSLVIAAIVLAIGLAVSPERGVRSLWAELKRSF